MKNTEIMIVEPIHIEGHNITIVGDGDLVLNKMNAPTVRALTDQRKDRQKSTEKPSEWECIITSMHWRDGTPADFSESGLRQALVSNAPCISAFGLKKSFGQAVVRGGIDKYSTKFDANANIIAPGGLVPIKFSEHHVDEKLMAPKRGAPVLSRLNRFSGWSATFRIEFVQTSFGIAEIVDIINRAGFGLGIGSGRSSGFGRYHVDTVE